MCGRFNLSETPRTLADYFGLPAVPPLQPRYNVAPSQPVLVIGLKADGQTRGLVPMVWGIVPHWSAGDRPAAFINARSETAAEKPTFRDAFRRRRCLIPASGFYEWARAGGRKQPYHFRRPGGGPLAFAGLWDRWEGPDSPLLTCCILTTAANELVKPLHDRLPAVLAPADFACWLDPAATPEALRPLLRPLSANALDSVAVSPLVNSPRNDGPELLAPAGAGDEP